MGCRSSPAKVLIPTNPATPDSVWTRTLRFCIISRIESPESFARKEYAVASFIIDGLETNQQTLTNGDYGLITETGNLFGATIFGSSTYSLQIDGGLNVGFGVLALASFSSDPTVNATVSIGESGQVTSLAPFGFFTASAMIDVSVTESFTLTNAGLISANTSAIRAYSDPAIQGASLQVINSGSISSTFEAAVVMAVGDGQATLFNSGTISTLGSFEGRVPDTINVSGRGFDTTTDLALITNTGIISNQTRVQGATPTAIAIGSISTEIENSGTIIGAITVFGLGTGETFTLNNSGTILGDIARFGVGDGTLSLINTGTIQGNITGSDLNDTITLAGGTVTGSISGGNGDDTINLIGGAVSGFVSGNLGNDTYLVDSAADLISETNTADTDTVISTISWTLGSGFDVLELAGTAAVAGNGNSAANQLYGNAADNILRGRGGIDLLAGGEGEDTLYGGSGNDVFDIDDLDTVVELAGQGIDTVNIAPSFDGTRHTLAANVENLVFVAPVGVTAIGNALNNTITTGGFDDTLNGTTGTDRLDGATGNDTYITDGGDTLLDAGGIDTVQSSVNFTLATGFENLTLTGTAVIGNGNSAANTIIGNAAANDLNGGLGADRMTGGAGRDDFIFKTALGASNIDRITDFNAAADTIRIDNAVFAGLAAGAIAAGAYVRNTSGNATDASDRIIYESDTGALWFDRDGTGAAAKVQFATLNTGLTLTAADFFVF
jgi:Ca2+-binding RTX toxin-like protein